MVISGAPFWFAIGVMIVIVVVTGAIDDARPWHEKARERYESWREGDPKPFD